jgi:nucleotide-binding universal stress UspA family protein
VGGAIVVGTDGSQSARFAVQCAARVAGGGGRVLHVVAAYAGSPAHHAEACRVLGRAVADVSPDVAVRQHAFAGRPSTALCRIAERERAELIVVGNRGSGNLLARLQRPVCERVVRRARCRVLVVDTRAHWSAVEDGARIALAHAEPMIVRVDHAPAGPRLYVGELRLHHGLLGEALVLDGLRRRGRVGAVELVLGGLLMGDDWRDFPFALRDW